MAAGLLIFCCALEPAFAQNGERFFAARESRERAASPAENLPRIRINSDLVLVPVLVTDAADRLVTGLQKEDFRLFDDTWEQQITQFSAEDAPVSIGVVFDCSGSMGPKLRKARTAVSEFLKASNPEDEFFLVSFNDQARLTVGFTQDWQEIQNRLTFLQSKGRTALLDAIYLALNELKHARHARKAILIISDGGDNSSRYSEREVKNRVREADVQIYSLGILEFGGRRGRTPEESMGPQLLSDIASASGGRLYEINDLGELPDIAVKVGSALRNMYVLGFAPDSPRRDGRYHRITVKLLQPQGIPKLRATFRSVYLAPQD